MNKFGVWALAIACAVPAASQTKTLVEKSQIVTTIRSDGAFGLPPMCDRQGRMYVRLNEPGKGALSGPLIKVAPDGTLEAKFDTTGALNNSFGIRPNGGIAVVHREGYTNVIENFAPDGKREGRVPLQKPHASLALQIALFPSGDIFVAHLPIKAMAEVYDPAGHLIKEIDLQPDKKSQSATKGTGIPVAVLGEDGYVYLLRPTSPGTVYVVSSTGELVRTFAVQMPTDMNRGAPTLQVSKGRMAISSLVGCSDESGCKGYGYVVADAKSGATVAEYFTDGKHGGGPLGCYLPDPDRFVNFSTPPHAQWLELIEVAAQ